MRKKVIVIGAGAAGLMAAAAASGKGHEVLVLEKNEKAGKKIYITGKGRCNLTNDCPTEDLFGSIVRNHKFLYSAVYGFDQTMTKAFFEENGCPVKTERGNRVFPVSDHASDVTAALLRCLKRNGVKILYETRVLKILTDKSSARVTGIRLRNGSELSADAVILCTGGLSYPSTGSTGDGIRWAQELGLDVVPPAPSLVPLETKEQWCRDLQGLALKNVSVRIHSAEEQLSGPGQDKKGQIRKKKKTAKPVYEGFGELLFTHFGLSGPIILTASCYCNFTKNPQGFRLILDLKPALTSDQLCERISREFSLSPNGHLPGAVRPLFPARLAEAVTNLSGLDITSRAASFTEQEIRALAELIKNIPVTLTGTRGFNEAIITRGGISVKEFNPSTMESLKVSGLYAAGEVLDVDAQTGGFNLQIAWSTGHLAGSSI